MYVRSSYREGTAQNPCGEEPLQSPQEEGVCKALEASQSPKEKDFAQKGGFIHTYVHLYAHFGLFTTDIGDAPQSHIQMGLCKPPRAL